jgi:hypothetical protein
MPTREHRKTYDGFWEVTVTPPPESGFNCVSTLLLDQNQFNRYCRWLGTGGLIQQMLPDLLPEQREQLLSGITPAAWNQAFGDNDHD